MIEPYRPARMPSYVVWVLAILGLGVIGNFMLNSISHDKLTAMDAVESHTVDSVAKLSTYSEEALRIRIRDLESRVARLEREGVAKK